MELVLIALISALAPSITIIVTYYFGKKHINATEQKVQANTEKLDKVHYLVNGRLEQALRDIADLKARGRS